MSETLVLPGLKGQGKIELDQVRRNLSTAALYEEVIRLEEGMISRSGAMVVNTGVHTGRSPSDKFIVREPTSEPHVDWGKINCPFEPSRFDDLYEHLLHYVNGKQLYAQDCWVGASPPHSRPVRIITELAWHSLFSRNLFRVRSGEDVDIPPEYTVIDVPGFEADPLLHETNTGTFILVHLAKKLVLIGGSSYAGEIKKSIFTIMNYRLPLDKILSMHCSANIGDKGDVALFFGLSGTGKTTLSADADRGLIGDDEHGWSDEGIFNFEGGCYAKVIRLSAEAEPEIYQCSQRFGTVLENVVLNPTSRELDFNDSCLTENTRAAYPLASIRNAVIPSVAGHPENIVMLTCDAFGVLPPIARLTEAQAMYHFLSGYTAKVAGTEKGLGHEPSATFSTCFGAPFMALRPNVYADLLGEKIARHHVNCWLVNTGWSGGEFGAGHRIKIAFTRAMIHAALNGKLNGTPSIADPIFRVLVPEHCDGVPGEILRPRNTWTDQSAYDRKAHYLAGLFQENFQQFDGVVSPKVRNAGPNAQ